MYSHTEILKKIPLFSKLNAKELEELTHIANAQTHQKGSILIEEGTYGGELYILINGELSIWKKDTTGHALELSQLKEAGDFVGEMSLFDQKPRSATVEVRKKSEILKIERKDLLSKLSNPQNILIKILEEISLRFREFDDKYFHEILAKTEALEKANQELQKLDELKSNFISLSSHELKTPLNSILNASSLLLEFMKDKLNENEKKCFGLINTNAKRLNYAYDQIIRVAELENPHIELQGFEDNNINLIIDEVVDEISPFIEKRNQKLTVNKGTIPLIPLNKEQIRQAVLNVILNSIKFTPDTGEIIISSSRKNDYLEIQVKDTGIGISLDEQEKIFDSFYEIGNINTHKSGTYEFMSKGLGLGLSIAKKFIETNKGVIRVQSKEGQGATFIISFKI